MYILCLSKFLVFLGSAWFGTKFCTLKLVGFGPTIIMAMCCEKLHSPITNHHSNYCGAHEAQNYTLSTQRPNPRCKHLKTYTKPSRALEHLQQLPSFVPSFHEMRVELKTILMENVLISNNLSFILLLF